MSCVIRITLRVYTRNYSIQLLHAITEFCVMPDETCTGNNTSKEDITVQKDIMKRSELNMIHSSTVETCLPDHSTRTSTVC